MLNIVFGFDDRFAKFCGAAMASILTNHIIKSGEDKICFFLPNNISAQNKKRLLELKKIQDFQASFYDVDISALKGLPIGVWSIATYYKLLIPEILDVDKIIVLDSDIIVKKDISLLWNIDISAYLAAAVRVSQGADSGTYFNAGIVVFNLKKLRQFNFSAKWRDYIKTNPNLICVDQDILNPVLSGNMFYLPIEFNVNGEKHYDYMLRNNILDRTVILHYTPGKPLDFDCPPSLRKIYFKYSAMTYWKENMRHFWIRRFRINPAFFLRPKYWKKIKEMKQKEKIGA